MNRQVARYSAFASIVVAAVLGIVYSLAHAIEDAVRANDEHRDPGEQPGADIARHLARHGLSVRVVAQPRQGRSIGEALLQFVDEDGSDLLVMGGYGHSRWREAILGGTTRRVLEGMRTPVLFAH